MLQGQTFLEARLFELARQHNIDVSAIDGSASLLARNAPDAELQALANLIRRLRALLNDELMGMTARPVPAGTFDISMRAAMHARTLGAFLLQLIGAAELMYSPPDLRCSIETSQGDVTISFDNAFHPEDDFYFAFAFMSTHRGMCWLIDERILLLRVELRSSDAAHLQDLRHIFQCEVRDAQPRNAIVFSRHYLDAAIDRSLGEFDDYLRRRPLDVLYLPGQDRSLSGRVTRLLSQAIERGEPRPDARRLCAELRLTTHGLSRQLAREGWTLQKLKDRLLFEAAVRELKLGSLPIEQIALRLGYEEPNSFCRAFKRWAGVSPQGFRARGSASRGQAGRE